MTRKIFQSIMLVSGLVLTAVLSITVSILYKYFTALQEDQLNDGLRAAVVALEQGGTTVLARLVGEHSRLTWVAADGSVLYDSRAATEAMQNHADRDEIQQALRTGQGKSVRYSATLMEKTLYQACKLPDGSVLRISMSSATVWTLLVRILQPFFLVFVLILAFSAMLARSISRGLTKPLNQLNLEKPLENDTYPELAPLLLRIEKQQRQINHQLTELQRKNDEFDQITENMREGLVLLNEKKSIVFINKAARHLFQTDTGCLGRSFQMIDRRPELEKALEKALEEGHSQLRAESNERYYHYDINRIDSHGAVAGAVLLTFDITDQAFSERNRREFTANVSHELKTPLQSIIGRAELIENSLAKAEDVPVFAGQIRQESLRLVAMIEDILRLSRLDEGESLAFEDLDLAEAVHRQAAVFQDIAADKGITLTVHSHAVHMQGVRYLLNDILYNLCDNAIKYNKPGGNVCIDVSQEGQSALLSIRDTGIGIPLAHQDRIFERFYRVDKSHNKKIAGNGLGLSIVKHAVTYMKGKISVHSSPGKGTRITISFPIQKQAVPALRTSHCVLLHRPKKKAPADFL